MKKKRKPLRSWTNEELLKTAKKYKTRTEWATKDNSSYCIAGRRGIRDKCAAHMGVSVAKQLLYTDEDIMAVARKYKYLKDFRENDTSAYSLAIKRNITKKVCAHMFRYSKARTLSDKEILQIGSKYRLKSQWRVRNFPSFNEAEKRGLLQKWKPAPSIEVIKKFYYQIEGENKNGKGKNKKNWNE